MQAADMAQMQQMTLTNIPPETAQALEREAARLALRPSQVARMWLTERARAHQQDTCAMHAATEHAVAVADHFAD